MRDPLTWSLPLGRLFGITVRMHVLFPLVAVGLILRATFAEGSMPDTWIHAAGLMLLLFFAVLLHEFGHCFGARLVDGDAHEILLWPLGGLASIEVPHTPRANFIAAAAGPLVNVFLCAICGGVLAYFAVTLPLNPFWTALDRVLPNHQVVLPWQLWLARFFWLNWVLFLMNVVLIGFPLDGGRMFQCILWPRFGFRQATLAAIFAGFVVTLVVGVFSIVQNEILALCLALFIYVTCRQQWIILEHGGEESLFGYDFSQGYTSLERDQPPRRRRPNVFQRWLQRRRIRRMQREEEQRENEERRMDELLEKIQREGQQALTDEERRFLTRVSAKYRNRQ